MHFNHPSLSHRPSDWVLCSLVFSLWSKWLYANQSVRERFSSGYNLPGVFCITQGRSMALWDATVSCWSSLLNSSPHLPAPHLPHCPADQICRLHAHLATAQPPCMTPILRPCRAHICFRNFLFVLCLPRKAVTQWPFIWFYSTFNYTFISLFSFMLYFLL